MAGKRRQVLAVTEREVNGERKTFWTRIGSAFDNADGSITLLCDAVALSGKMQIRDDDDKRGKGTDGAPF